MKTSSISKIGITKSTDQGRTWSYVGIAQGPSRGLKEETFWAPHVFKEKGIEFKRTSLQVAEFELKDAKVTCDRDSHPGTHGQRDGSE